MLHRICSLSIPPLPNSSKNSNKSIASSPSLIKAILFFIFDRSFSPNKEEKCFSRRESAGARAAATSTLSARIAVAESRISSILRRVRSAQKSPVPVQHRKINTSAIPFSMFHTSFFQLTHLNRRVLFIQ